MPGPTITNTEAAEMAERAALEIKRLRSQNETLAQKADAYDVLRSAIIGLSPKPGSYASEDLAYRLEQRAKELRGALTEKVIAEE